MKLIFCPKCQDVFKLDSERKMRTCKCGASKGRYLKDGLNAVIRGLGVPIGLSNKSLYDALVEYNQEPQDLLGVRLDCRIDSWIFTEGKTIKYEGTPLEIRKAIDNYIKIVDEYHEARKQHLYRSLYGSLEKQC